MKALDRLDQWGNRLYRLDPDRLDRELPLRAQLLRRILVFVALGCGLYLILGAAGISLAKSTTRSHKGSLASSCN
jgi:hypothetical protein